MGSGYLRLQLARPALLERKQHIESMGLTSIHNKEQFMGK